MKTIETTAGSDTNSWVEIMPKGSCAFMKIKVKQIKISQYLPLGLCNYSTIYKFCEAGEF